MDFYVKVTFAMGTINIIAQVGGQYIYGEVFSKRVAVLAQPKGGIINIEPES